MIEFPGSVCRAILPGRAARQGYCSHLRWDASSLLLVLHHPAAFVYSSNSRLRWMLRAKWPPTRKQPSSRPYVARAIISEMRESLSI